MEENQKGFWNTLKAKWYQKGLKYSTLPKIALNIILPQTRDCKSFLDVGSGCGTFAMPLAKAGKTVRGKINLSPLCPFCLSCAFLLFLIKKVLLAQKSKRSF